MDGEIKKREKIDSDKEVSVPQESFEIQNKENVSDIIMKKLQSNGASLTDIFEMEFNNTHAIAEIKKDIKALNVHHEKQNSMLSVIVGLIAFLFYDWNPKFFQEPLPEFIDLAYRHLPEEVKEQIGREVICATKDVEGRRGK